MKRTFYKTLLTLYGALPFLCTGGILIAEKSHMASIVSALAIAIFQGVFIPIILEVKQRKNALTFYSIFIFLTVITSLYFGRIYSNLYNLMLLNYYPGPALTLAYTLVFRFSRFREMETMGRSIRFFLLLLLSYMLMIFMISVYDAVEQRMITLLFLPIIEALNYCPSLILLNMLAASCRKELYVTETSVIYHNTDYTSIFSQLQLSMLQKLCSTGSIRCRDFSAPGTVCPEEEICKATQCTEYSRIYRNVQELSNKLRNLGLGELVPPENKRDVVSKGWSLKLYEGIGMKKRKRGPGIISIKAQINSSAISSGKSSRKWIMTPASAVVLILGSLYLSASFIQPASIQEVLLFLIVGLFEIMMFLLPFVFNRFNRFQTGFIIFASVLFALFFISVSYYNEYFAFIQLIKNWSLILILLMLNLPKWEDRIQITDFRAQISIILFWSIWFFMASSAIVSDIYLIWPVNLKVFDKLLLYTLMVLSVMFHTLPRKKLEIRGTDLFINAQPLAEGLSEINKSILIEFLMNPGSQQKCRGLLLFSEAVPAETIPDDCADLCKSSACKPYKRLYKRIRVISHYLESNSLGTIKSSVRTGSSEPGWELQLNEDVFLPRSS